MSHSRRHWIRADGRPAIWGHRGAPNRARENTLAAFAAAADEGATGVELDVRLAAGHALLLHHDVTLADGTPVAVLDEANRPSWMPTLAESLDALRGLVVNIELKHYPGESDHNPEAPIADAVVALLAERGGRDQVIVSCFDWPTLERVRALAPAVPTGLLHVGRSAAAALAHAAAGGHAAVHPHLSSVDAAMVAEAHAVGIAVHVWTVDDPDQMRELAAAGVDAIITNEPARAAEVLGR